MSSTSRVFPANHAETKRRVTLLSIIDASILRFSACSAFWIFENRTNAHALEDRPKRLLDSLEKVLSHYPHFAGQLKYVTDLNTNDQDENVVLQKCGGRTLGRVVVAYGSDHDPGVAFKIVQSERTVKELLSIGRSKEDLESIWITTDFPINEIESQEQIAFHRLSEYKLLPSVAIQLTNFTCGGFAMNVKISHCLSDAASLCQFVNTWSKIFNGTAIVPPLFQPDLLDRHVGLASDAPDLDQISIARNLPMHRFDWYGAGPEWMEATTFPTKPINCNAATSSPATDMPWETWDRIAPIARVELRFNSTRASELKSQATATLPKEISGTISRLDAVLAYLWLLVGRARGYADLDEAVYLNSTLGIRPRLGLPENFVGSPIMIMYTEMSGRELVTSSLGSIAAKLRQVVNKGTGEAAKAYMHDVMHEVSPQRLWQAFLGHRHLLFTSWLRLPMYDVEFGSGKPLYAQGVMPLLDGLVQTIDADGCICINLALEEKAMKKLLKIYINDKLQSEEASTISPGRA